MTKSGMILMLREIAANEEGQGLDHHTITVFAHGMLQLLPDVTGISQHYEEIELMLKMLTTRAPYHARCKMAEKALDYILKCEEEVPFSGEFF